MLDHWRASEKGREDQAGDDFLTRNVGESAFPRVSAQNDCFHRPQRREPGIRRGSSGLHSLPRREFGDMRDASCGFLPTESHQSFTLRGNQVYSWPFVGVLSSLMHPGVFNED